MATCVLDDKFDGAKLRRTHIIKKTAKLLFLHNDSRDISAEEADEGILNAVNVMLTAHQTFVAKNNNTIGEALRIDNAMGNTKEFIESVIGKGKETRFTDDEKKLIAMKVNDITRRLINAGFDPFSDLEDTAISAPMKALLEKMYYQHKGDFMLSSRFPAILQSFLVDRHRFFRKFRPAFEVMSKKFRLKNSMMTARTNFINKAQKIVLEASRNYDYNDKMINELLPLLNGYNGREKDQDERVRANNARILDEFRQALTSMADVDEEEIPRVIENFLAIKKSWDILNYGERYMSGESDTPDEDSIVAFYDKSLRIYQEIYQERKRYEEYSIGEYSIDPIETALNEKGNEGFSFRKGYVPGSGEISEYIPTTDFESKFPRLSSVLHHQDVDKERGDFINSFTDSIMEFTFKLETVATLSSIGAMKGALNKHADWVRMNKATASVIQHFADNMWKITTSRQLQDPRHEILRNFLHPILMIQGPMMLANPASGVNNTLGGKLAMGLKFGKHLTSASKAFKEAISNENSEEHDIAVIVDKIAKREYQDLGTIQDFQIQKSGQASQASGLLSLSRTVRDMIMTVADASTRRGLLGILGITDKFSTKNTEENYLRSSISPLLYDQVQLEISVRRANGEKIDKHNLEKVVSEIIHKEGPNIHEDLNDALGVFEPENKPFWTWEGINSNSAPKIILGSLGSTWYMFRQIAVTNLYLLKDLRVEMNPRRFNKDGAVVSDLYRSFLNRRENPGGVSFFLLMLLAGYHALGTLNGIMGKRGKEYALVASVAETVNPAQELNVAGDVAIGYIHKFVAPILNLPVNEAEFNYIKQNALHLAGGVLAGGTLEQIMENRINESPLGKAYINSFVDSYNALQDALHNDGYVERRKAVSKLLSNPSPYVNYSNDYISAIAQVFLALSKTNNDKEFNQKTRTDLFSFIAKTFGFNVYQHPTLWNQGQLGNGYKLSYDLNKLLYAQQRRRKYSKSFGNYNANFLRQLSEYNKVYQASLIKQATEATYAK